MSEWIKVDDYHGNFNTLKEDGWWVGGYSDTGEWRCAGACYHQEVENIEYVCLPEYKNDQYHLPEQPEDV